MEGRAKQSWISSYLTKFSPTSSSWRKIGHRMRAFSMLVLSLAIFGLAFSAAAQTAQPTLNPSAIIAEIHATGSHHYNDAEVASAAGLKPGDTVTREQLQAAADRLVQLGVFSRVSYRFTSEGNKITVEYTLEDAPTVPVSFDNFPWFTDEELSNAIREVVPLFDGDAPPDGAAVDTIASAIAKLFPARGIVGTVEHALMAQASADGNMLQFRVEGSNVKIASLDYGDSLAQNSEFLKDRNSDLLGKPFSRYAIEVFENEQLRPLYIAAGHLRVRFGTPVVHFIVDATQSPSSNLAVSIPIDPGPVFHISSVTWSGASVPLWTLTLTTLLATKLRRSRRRNAANCRVATNRRRVRSSRLS